VEGNTSTNSTVATTTVNESSFCRLAANSFIALYDFKAFNDKAMN
jgi:hypothetical protein